MKKRPLTWFCQRSEEGATAPSCAIRSGGVYAAKERLQAFACCVSFRFALRPAAQSAYGAVRVAVYVTPLLQTTYRLAVSPSASASSSFIGSVSAPSFVTATR